jgi:flagellar protein FliS
MMLYDGAIRFGEQARLALEKKNFEESYNNISRVQKIITELSCTLKHNVAPELCGKLAALYNYAYRKLIEANIEHKVTSLNEAMDVLRFQRDTWAMLMDQIGKKKAAAAATLIDMPSPDSRMEAGIRLTG